MQNAQGFSASSSGTPDLTFHLPWLVLLHCGPASSSYSSSLSLSHPLSLFFVYITYFEHILKVLELNFHVILKDTRIISTGAPVLNLPHSARAC